MVHGKRQTDGLRLRRGKAAVEGAGKGEQESVPVALGWVRRTQPTEPEPRRERVSENCSAFQDTERSAALQQAYRSASAEPPAILQLL